MPRIFYPSRRLKTLEFYSFFQPAVDPEACLSHGLTMVAVADLSQLIFKIRDISEPQYVDLTINNLNEKLRDSI